MAGTTEPRFKSREAALRFYFRASELLAPNAKPGLFSSRRPPKLHPGPNLISDLFALDSCFHGLNDVQLCLLRETFRPGAFTTRPRPLAQVSDSLRCKFPKNDLTTQQIAQFKREALKIFEAHLIRERLM